ncbi:MAG: transcription antitermination factor NusB [Candidatus Heteroscillospira sp.]|jgi:N utilization substance protein B
MTRAAAREIAVQLCFASSGRAGNVDEALDSFFEKEYYATLGGVAEGFADYPNGKQQEYIRGVVRGVSERLEEIDGYIERFARGWKVSRISKTALAVLRVAIYEILYVSDVPGGVAISEAVELAKGYDVPETVSFINGVLGSFIRALNEPAPLEEAGENEAQTDAEPEQPVVSATEE